MTEERIKELREKFYKECTRENLDGKYISKEPDSVFQWFVENFKPTEGCDHDWHPAMFSTNYTMWCSKCKQYK